MNITTSMYPRINLAQRNEQTSDEVAFLPQDHPFLATTRRSRFKCGCPLSAWLSTKRRLCFFVSFFTLLQRTQYLLLKENFRNSVNVGQPSSVFDWEYSPKSGGSKAKEWRE